MSGYNNNWSENDDFESEVGSHGGGGLRKLLEEALAENKKLVARLERDDREKSAAAVLEDKGLDPALVALIPEGMTADEYVEKFGHLLGVKSANGEQKQLSEPEIQAQNLNEEDAAVAARREELAAEQAARDAMQDAQEGGSPAVQSDLIDAMNKCQSVEELEAFFRKSGVVSGG